MARKAMPWLRLYTELPTDRKIRRLSIEHRWLWICVLCEARRSPVEGWLLVSEREPLTVDDLADVSTLKPKVVQAGLNKFLELGMLEKDEEIGAFRVEAWSARQRQSDTSTDRVRAWRAARNKALKDDSNGVETVSSRFGNGDETALETRQKTEQEDRARNPLSPPCETDVSTVAIDTAADEFIHSGELSA